MLSLVRKLDGGSRSFWMVLLLFSMVFGTGLSTFARTLQSLQKAAASNRVIAQSGLLMMQQKKNLQPENGLDFLFDKFLESLGNMLFGHRLAPFHCS